MGTIIDILVAIGTFLLAIVTTIVTAIGTFVVFVSCRVRKWLRPTTLSGTATECTFEWEWTYRIEENEDDGLIKVEVRIRLMPDNDVDAEALDTQKPVWAAAVHDTWSEKFPIRRRNGNCSPTEHRVVVDVAWEPSSSSYNNVRVQAGSGRPSAHNWFITSDGVRVAHEVGHLLGLKDEQPDPDCPAREVHEDDSLMGDGFSVRPRHYQPFADWVSTCCRYDVIG